MIFIRHYKLQMDRTMLMKITITAIVILIMLWPRLGITGDHTFDKNIIRSMILQQRHLGEPSINEQLNAYSNRTNTPINEIY